MWRADSDPAESRDGDVWRLAIGRERQRGRGRVRMCPSKAGCSSRASAAAESKQASKQASRQARKQASNNFGPIHQSTLHLHHRRSPASLTSWPANKQPPRRSPARTLSARRCAPHSPFLPVLVAMFARSHLSSSLLAPQTDLCISNAIVKTGIGFSAGVVLSVLLFRRE